MSANTISIIVPVYKVERYLHRCIDSILAQTFTDFELILVDDGSPDNCGVICDEYAAKDERIHVIHQKNGGLSAARNAGIDWAFANSDSSWLSFIDSDDWVHPFFLEYLYRAVTESGTTVSACNFNKVKEQKPASMEKTFSLQVRAWDQFFSETKVMGTVACCKLYAKDLFLGLRYPLGRINEDEFLTYKLLYKAKTISCLEEALYFYYVNPEGIMSSKFTLSRLDGIEALEEEKNFARNVKSNTFLEYCIKSEAFCITQLIFSIEREKCNEAEKKALRSLRTRLRWNLFEAWMRKIMSFSDNKWYFEAAFPFCMKLYWKAVSYRK